MSRLWPRRATMDHANFPAESPNVLAVGGTDLYLTTSGAISSETAWTATTSGSQTWSGGGGISTEFPGRDVPDVAYNAGVGMAVYDTFGPDTGWVSVGGTSAGARNGQRSWLLPTKAVPRRPGHAQQRHANPARDLCCCCLGFP